LAVSLTARGGREIPARFSTFQTVECAKPVAPATNLGPQPVSRRQEQIAPSNSGRTAAVSGAADSSDRIDTRACDELPHPRRASDATSDAPSPARR
jgi:hypothetical protein